MGKKGVESMIEEIKVYIENCKPMPLSQTKISVQKPELLSMLMQEPVPMRLLQSP